MPIELLSDTTYVAPEYHNSTDSLFHASNRGRMNTPSGSPERFVSSVSEILGLAPFEEIITGRKGVMRIFHGSLYVPNFGKEDKTFVRLGVAAEGAIDPDSKDGPKSRSLIVRLSDSFYAEDFADDVKGLLEYQRLSKLPAFVRGQSIELGLVSGLGIGVTAGFWLTGDFASTIAFGVTGAAIMTGAGNYIESMDQCYLTQRVPNPEEYFAGGKAVEKIEKIVSHIETVKVLHRIEVALKRSGVRLSTLELLDYWNTDDDIFALRDEYSLLLNQGMSSDREAAELRVVSGMIDQIRLKSSDTSL